MRRGAPARQSLRRALGAVDEQLRRLYHDRARNISAFRKDFAKRFPATEEPSSLPFSALATRAFSETEFSWCGIEAAIGLTSPACEFRDRVTEAVTSCALRHLARSYRGAQRQDWEEAAAHFEAAAAELGKARTALARVMRVEAAHEVLQAEQEALDAWASSIRKTVDLTYPRWRPAHRPARMQAFADLVMELAITFQHATGVRPSVSWNAVEERYQGRFLALVDGVRPVLSQIVRECGIPPLRQPTSACGRGRFILRVLHSTKDKTSPHAH